MAGFKMEEWIARPPAQVFDLLSDMRRATEMVPAVTEVQKLTEGPVGAGTRYRETRQMNGKPQQTELEVVRYEPPTDYAVSNVTSGVETVYHYRLASEGEGTRVTLQATVEGKGLRAVMVPVLSAILQREDGDHLAQLKAFAER